MAAGQPVEYKVEPQVEPQSPTAKATVVNIGNYSFAPTDITVPPGIVNQRRNAPTIYMIKKESIALL